VGFSIDDPPAGVGSDKPDNKLLTTSRINNDVRSASHLGSRTRSLLRVKQDQKCVEKGQYVQFFA
jgi:hypothetical protein